MEYLEIIGTIIGLAYLWLEYKANKLLWIAGIIMPAIYIFVYYNAGLYADFGINIYYLLIAIYGFIAWSGNDGKKKKKQLKISKLGLQELLLCVVAFCVLFLVIAYVLINFTNSNVPWLDSFTTALSIVAMWMLARKYIEQWIAWIAVDAVSCGLYVYKDLHFTAALYGLYTVIAIFGYFKWRQMMLAGK